MGMSASRVLVAGAAGQLAAAIVEAFGDRTVVGLVRTALDITDPVAVERAVRDAAPDVIVNCAAFNDVDGAESRPLEALAVNAFGVRNLARQAERSSAVLVHYSTDFVFDGTAHEPYDEDARPSPLSTYAGSKLLGEWLALEAPRAYVLRVESLFGTPRGWPGRRGSLDGIVERLEAGTEVTVFTDRVVSPSYTVDVAGATRHLVDTGAAPGVYHCVNGGAATWHDVALEAAGVLGVEPRLRPARMADTKFKAARPRYCALATGKLARAGYAMPAWQDALRRWLRARDGMTHATNE
jgi:dTDP-4-dehydrorhamnose reductase